MSLSQMSLSPLLITVNVNDDLQARVNLQLVGPGDIVGERDYGPAALTHKREPGPRLSW